MPKANANRAELEAWKKGEGKWFVDKLALLTDQFTTSQPQHFDPDNNVHLQQARKACHLYQQFYTKVQTVFNAYLMELTGLTLPDVFSLPQEVGESVHQAFGHWVLMQSYLDAGEGEGNGRLERIVAEEAAYKQKRVAWQRVEVPASNELKALWDKHALYEAACYPWRNWVAAKKARKKIGGEMRGMVTAVFRGRKKLRALRREVATTDDALSRAEELTQEIAELRKSVLAALAEMNGLPSGLACFKELFRVLLDLAKQGQPLIDEAEVASAVWRAEAEENEAEELLQCLKKLMTQRETNIGVGIRYVYDIQDPAIAKREETELASQVAALMVKTFAEELKQKVARGSKEGIIDFRTDTTRRLNRLRLRMPQTEAIAALRGVLSRQIQELETKASAAHHTDLLATLKKNLEILR